VLCAQDAILADKDAALAAQAQGAAGETSAGTPAAVASSAVDMDAMKTKMTSMMGKSPRGSSGITLMTRVEA